MKRLMLIALLSYFSAHAMENEIKRAVLEGNIARVRELIEQGANIHGRYEHEYWESCCGDRWTLLHYAVWSECPAMVELLLNRGADINAQKGNYSTPLHLAACNNFGDSVALLLDRGADMNVKNETDATPYNVARGEMHKTMENFRARKLSKVKGISTAEGAQ